MKMVCGWCGKHISGDKDDSDISHGICKDCEKKEREELEKTKKGRCEMKTEGYTKLLFFGLIVLVIVIFGIFLIDPITGLYEQIIKALEEIGH